jgi:leucyl-tRNA---protein transferase
LFLFKQENERFPAAGKSFLGDRIDYHLFLQKMPIRRFTAAAPLLYGRTAPGAWPWLELTVPFELAAAYGAGHLPYSGDPAEPRHLFYHARSLRVDLAALRLDKKRRHDQRGWSGHGLRREHGGKAAFLARHGDAAQRLAFEWMASRFGMPYMSAQRLEYVLAKPFLQDVLAWYRESTLAAFALIVRGEGAAHYWFAFYEHYPAPAAPESASAPGHGYLVDFLEWAAESGHSHAYLGTGYGLKSRYKSRGISGVEFHDGSGWCADKAALARLQEQD